MNKKGFTLIELLGVILIISLLVIIVLPKITNSVTNFNPKIDKLTMNMFEQAVKLYTEDNAHKFEEGLYDYSCVPLTELVDKGYLKGGMQVSGKDITKTKTLKITYEDDYKIELVNNNECIISNPGLYDENNVLLATWDELVEKGLDLESDFNTSTTPNPKILNSYANKYKLVVDGSVTQIGDSALYSCSKLLEIILPKTVTSIGSNAFCSNSSLTSIKLPKGVIKIETYAFQNCSGLRDIIIPESVTKIEKSLFVGCSKLERIVIDENNSVYDSRENSNAIIETASNKLIAGCKNTIIPNSVTSIGDSAFERSSLISITIPNSVTSIGKFVFSSCNNLESIIVDENNSVYDSRENSNAIIETSNNKLIAGCKNTIIPNSVTSIGDNAFYSHSGLTSITIPNGVTSIGSSAFYSNNLTSITIPSSVTTIGTSAFAYCTKLESIVVDENNSVYDSRDNSNAIIETSSNKLITGCKNTIIPNSVTSIGASAFYGHTGLTNVTIPNGVTSIGSSAFFGTGLTSITIPSGVKSIGSYAFAYNYSLLSITIPNSVTNIGNYAFNGCSKLTTIYYSGTATGSPWGAPSATVLPE